MSEFKPNEAGRAAANEAAWQSVCAKLGQPDAMHVRAGGTLTECHDKRKAVRRAVNALTVSTADRDPTIEEIGAYEHAGQLVARLDSFIEGFESIKPGAEAFKPLRTPQDFQNHYRKANQGRDADFDIADFLRGVANMGTVPGVRAALSEGTDSAGGYTVPGVLMPGILSALAPASSLLQAGAGIVLLGEGAKSYTFAGIDTLPTAAWRLEAGALAESDPTFRAVTAAPKSLSFRFKISRELLADGQNLTGALYTAIAQAFAKEMDRAGLRGTGTNPEPRGLLNTSGIQAVGNGTNGASLATTRYGNFFTAVQAVMTANGPMPTAAIMSPRSRVTLASQLDTTGQPLMAPQMLSTMQMIVSSQIPINLTVGSSSDCSELYLGDFGQMVFMLRESPSVQVLNELYAATGEIGFACHARVDIAVLRPSVFAVVTGVRA